VKKENRSLTAMTEPCMRCGRDASQGRKITLELGRFPGWAWLGLFLGVIHGLSFFLASHRTPRQFSYSLCPRCAKIRLIKQIVAGLAWAALVGTLVAGITTGQWELWGGIAFWLFFVAAFATGASSRRLIREKALYRPHA